MIFMCILIRRAKNFDWDDALLVEGFETMMMMMHFC